MQLPPTIVALSGPDNVGKSTHVRLLARRHNARDLGPLDEHDPRWQAAKCHGLATWWFVSAPMQEVVDVLASSYLARASAARHAAGTLQVIDRGMTMLEASVVATVAVRDHLPRDAAAERARDLLAPYAGDIARAASAESEFMFLHDVDARRSAERALSRETSVSTDYARYQQALNEHLHLAAQAPIVIGNLSILAAHAELCTRAGLAPPVITGRWTVALGGMSECGKSTAADHLQREHGFARLKIGYLAELAAARHQILDVYALPPAELAELVALELDRYASAHHYQGRFSIESLHRAELTAELVKLLGDALTVVYLDASPQVRQQRGVDGPADVIDRDQVKRSRGADRIAAIADVVIDNSRSRVELGHALDRLVRGRCRESRAPRVLATADLGLPDRLTGFLNHLLAALTGPSAVGTVDLIAVTGSSARGKYLEGWSDLDMLVVADMRALPPINSALNEIRSHLGGVKLGFTVISQAECRAGTLTPRLLYTIASIADGSLPVLWAAPRFRLPHPDPGTVTARNRHDCATAAIDLRRLLLKDPLDLRALYKVAAMLAKVVLRHEGQTQDGDAQALEAFGKLAGIPRSVTDPRQDPAATAALAGQVLTWWLATLEPAA
ncbi:nucleotidyltransferase domain-containing protein [Sphaerisporangium sp. NPDC051017]|uniref:nucleotidyltransferase domain-containing protein n=1 Tax=Sphaerisporangium sp. NPDC051017 TaxID=3154636 RepID=UPI00343B609D